MSDNHLMLEKAREIERRRRHEQSLLEQLPQLEKEAQAKAQAEKIAHGYEVATKNFNAALASLKRSDDKEVNELLKDAIKPFRRVFLALIGRTKEIESLRRLAQNVAYYQAASDPIFGLTADNQRHLTDQILIDNGVRSANLPLPVDRVEAALYEALYILIDEYSR